VQLTFPCNGHHHFLFQRDRIVLKPPARPSLQLMKGSKKEQKRHNRTNFFCKNISFPFQPLSDFPSGQNVNPIREPPYAQFEYAEGEAEDQPRAVKSTINPSNS